MLHTNFTHCNCSVRFVQTCFTALLILFTQTSWSVDYTRTVVAGGSIVEIIYELEAQNYIVAVDRTSQYPEAAKSKKNIGYVRRLSAEPIISVSPTLLIVESDAGPESALDQLTAAGVDIIKVNDDITIEGVVEKIRVVAAAFERKEAGEDLASKLEKSVSSILKQVVMRQEKAKVMFMLSAGRGAPLVAGENTSANSIIELSGAVNALSGFEGYKPASVESIVGANPDVVLVTNRTTELLGGVGEILKRPEIAATEAGKSGNIISMDGLLLLGFGPRVDQAIKQLATGLYPDIKFE